MAKRKKWRDYEKMIARIYQELEPLATVTHDDKIIGKESKIERQIDVSIRAKLAGHEILIIVQARDYKNPPDVNDVGELASVIKDVGASKGILISNIGFTEGAKNLAKSLEIDLCSAHDAESRNWKNDLQIPVLWIEMLPILNFAFAAHLKAGDWLPSDIREIVFSSDKGETKIQIFETFVRLWNEDRIPKDVDKVHRFSLSNPDIHVLVGDNLWRPVDTLLCSYVVVKRGWLKYFTPDEFRGIRNFLTGDITVSKFRLGIKAPFPRDDSWAMVEDLDNVPVEVKAIIATIENPQISIDGADFSELHMESGADG